MTESTCAIWCQDTTAHANEKLAEDRYCYRYTDDIELSVDHVELEDDGVRRQTVGASLEDRVGQTTVALDYSGGHAGTLTIDEAEQLHKTLGELLQLAKAGQGA